MTQITPGTEIPALVLPPVNRTVLALFAGASGDHNPVHIDIDFARSAGMPDVIAHGMLSMAYLGRMLTDWQPQARLRKFSSRFAAITHVHDVIACQGKVVEIIEENGESLARCEIQAAKADGERTLIGEALVAL
jgi:acyl dehydratase